MKVVCKSANSIIKYFIFMIIKYNNYYSYFNKNNYYSYYNKNNYFI